jgi:hypothetical protein
LFLAIDAAKNLLCLLRNNLNTKENIFFARQIWAVFRPEEQTKNYCGIFVFGRATKNEKNNEIFCRTKNDRFFVQAYLGVLCCRDVF